MLAWSITNLFSQALSCNALDRARRGRPQIGADSRSLLKEGILTEWDTSGLNGLYALQLLVVHSDNGITTATVMVTIKN